jgi:hypothetical protein
MTGYSTAVIRSYSISCHEKSGSLIIRANVVQVEAPSSLDRAIRVAEKLFSSIPLNYMLLWKDTVS